MKLLFVLLITISLINCGDDSGKRDRNPELTGDDLSSEDTANEISESKELPINNFKIAQNILNVKGIKKDSSVCDFKNDHLTGDMFPSGANLMASEGSYTTIPTKIFKNSPGMNWRDDFKYIPTYHFFENDTLILPFKYDQHDTLSKYSDWCSTEQDCIVYVIFKGEIYEPLYPEKHYLYNGKLLIRIVFNEQLLDFSLCGKT